jgi:hypothetical protein
MKRGLLDGLTVYPSPPVLDNRGIAASRQPFLEE